MFTWRDGHLAEVQAGAAGAERVTGKRWLQERTGTRHDGAKVEGG